MGWVPLKAEAPSLDIDRLASEEGADPHLVRAVMGAESSGGKNTKTSPDGAMGAMQIIPATFKRFAKQGETIDNPEHNVRVGARYLKFLSDRVGGDPFKVGAAYLSGEGNVDQWGIINDDVKDAHGTRPSMHGKKIAEAYRKLAGDGGEPTDIKPSMFMLDRPQAVKPQQDIGVMGAAGRGITHGMIGLAESVNLGGQFLAGRMGAQGAQEFFKAGADWWSQLGEGYAPPPELQGNILEKPELLGKGAWWAYNVADMVPSVASTMVPALGTYSAMVKGPAAIARLARIGAAVTGGAVGGAQEGLQTYKTVLERGGSDGEAAVAGTLMGLASAGLNALSLDVLMGKSTAPLKKFFLSGGTESLTEYMEEPAEGAILSGTSVAKPEDDPLTRLREGANVVPPSFLLGGLGGLGGGTRKETAAPPAPGKPPAAGATGGLPSNVNDVLGGQPGEPPPPGPGTPPADPGLVAPTVNVTGTPPEDINAPAAPLGGPSLWPAPAGVRSNRLGRYDSPENRPTESGADTGSSPLSPLSPSGGGGAHFQGADGNQYRVEAITPELFDEFIRPDMRDKNVRNWEEYHAKYPSITHMRLKSDDGINWRPSSAPFVGGAERLLQSTPVQTAMPILPDDAAIPGEAPITTPQAEDAVAPAENAIAPPDPVQTSPNDVQSDVQTPPPSIDDQAQEAATSQANDIPEPTEAQQQAGNYKKGHVKLHGLDISIENPRGSVRSGTDEDGKAWESVMQSHYGYIRRTEGADGDHIDTFIGPNPGSEQVFVVDQINPKTGAFDEHKIMVGFDSQEEAESAYRANFDPDWKGMGAVTPMSAEEFRTWLKDGDVKGPVSKSVGIAGLAVPEVGRTRPGSSQPLPADEPAGTSETGETGAEPDKSDTRHDNSGDEPKAPPPEKPDDTPPETPADAGVSASGEKKPEPKSDHPPLNLIQTSTGRWVFVGKVPDEVYYVEGATPDEIRKGKQFGERFGPKKRVFDTKEEAIAHAESFGYSVIPPDELKKPEPPKAPKQVSGYGGHSDRFADHEKELAGRVVYSHGDIALLEGFSVLDGMPVYVGLKGSSRTRIDIDSFTGKLFTADELAELQRAKAAHVAEQDRLHKGHPDGPFKSGVRVAWSDGISEELAHVARGWLEMLGIKARVFIVKSADVRADHAAVEHNLYGPFAAIRSAGLQAEHDGSARRLSNGDFYISLPSGRRTSGSLEVLAHEIGHILEKTEWASADAHTRTAVMAAYNRWLFDQGKPTAKDWVFGMRAHTTAKMTIVNAEQPSSALPGYWKSFSEFFADQVSRWATSSEKPLTVVDKWFAKIAKALRRLYASVAGKPWLPNAEMKAYLDGRTEAQPSATPEPAGASKADLSAMFDDVLAEEVAKDEKKSPPKPRAPKAKKAETPKWVAALGVKVGDRFNFNMPQSYATGEMSITSFSSDSIEVREANGAGTFLKRWEFERGMKDGAITPIAAPEKPAPRTATESATSAAKNTAAGLNAAIDGLGALFGGKGRLGSGPSFDEETYAKAKPLFQQAIAHFQAAGTDLKEAMRAVIRMVLDRFGGDAANAMKPYVVRFMEDVRDGNISTNAEGTGNERGSDAGEGTGPLDEVAPEQGGGTESVGDAGRDAAGGGDRGAEDDPGPDGAGVSAPRGGRGGAQGPRAPKAGGGRGRRGLGAKGTGGSGSSVSQRDEGAVAAPNIPATNYRITEDVRLGEGGEGEKFRDNLAAIRILKDLEREQRRATADEQRALARYVGWGGLKNAFSDDEGNFKSDWEARGKDLADLLTPAELKAARRSTRNAHYTSKTIVDAMWQAVRRLGFRGGMALESSMGTGNFLGLVPDEIAGQTHFVGVEYDSLTSRIARALYPQSTVLHTGFHKLPLPDGEFDLNIGNPPFGSESLRFQYNPGVTGKSIHNQFFLAGMDTLRPGGIQAMVVSRYMLDTQDRGTRFEMAKKARLLGAIRLPDTAFKENARTEVVTDILFFQKFTADEAAAMKKIIDAANSNPVKDQTKERERLVLAAKLPDWIDTEEVRDPLGGDPIRVNAYFASRPTMMMGTLERSGKMRQAEDVTVRLEKGADLGAMLKRALDTLPEGVMTQTPDALAQAAERFKTMSDALGIAVSGLEPGGIVLEGDTLSQVVERETPSGEYEMSKRALSPEAPWSPNLYLDERGRWFSLEVELDEDGNPKKLVKNGKATKLNAYVRKVYETEADVPATMRLGETRYNRIRAMVGLRDLLKNQLVLEAEDAKKADMERNRGKLSAAYDAFVKDHGFVNDPSNAVLVSEMPDGALVLALETAYVPEITAKRAKTLGESPRAASATKAPILSRRVVEPYHPPSQASTPADALVISLSESGRVDLERIAALLGVDEETAAQKLQEGEKPLAYLDPETKTWETRDAYLSGEVRRKLSAARFASMDLNVRALEEVQPEPWGAENVTAILGSTWVPTDVYEGFIEHLTGERGSVQFSRLTNGFQVRAPSTQKGQEWKTDDATLQYLLEKKLNSSAIRITYTDSDGKTHFMAEQTAEAQLKAKQIESEFQNWVFEDSARRDRLVQIFNDRFNTRVLRQFDGSHLILPGKVPDQIIRMRRHQMNAIWRGISQRFMLLDHVVGAGKTFTAIARAMERRRMGLSRKPTIVVPNHLVEQFAADTYRLYPGAKVLAATKKDFEKQRRRRLFAKIATGDWDLVIIPHSSFRFIGIAPETEERFLEEELRLAKAAIKEAEEAADEAGLTSGWRKPFNVKEAERLAETIEQRMDKLKARKADRLLTFEQMGIDDMTVDEAHEFKNLFYSSRLTGVRGMNDKTGSQKAFDLYNKIRVLRESPTGTVTFMTGTPISNSAVEMYTMMRYLAADELRDLGLEHFDAWRAQFVDTSTKWEPTESGRLKEVNRLGRTWSNMRSLMDLYYSITDAVSIDDIKRWFKEDNAGRDFPVPKVKDGGRRSVVVKPTPAQQSMLETILEGFDDLENISDVKARNAERLRLMDRARKVSLDVRAVHRGHPSKEEGGKLEAASDEIARIYKAWEKDRGTQLIFLDRSTPLGKGDDKVLKQYDKLVADRDQALVANDEEAYRELTEKLDEFDANEMGAVREAMGGGWNAYEQIKQNLIARGIPAKEIRFIHEANTDAQKQAIFDAMNGGEIRVLLGSTPRLGAGTNVQKRLVALHHIDVTWKPSDIEQREGRIIRQGNLLLDKYGPDFEVEILAYATERTVDAKMWDLNSTKLKTINGIRNYDGQFTMDFLDDDSVSMAEMAALASGDPMLMERVKLMSDIEQLELLERIHRRKVMGARSNREWAERTLRETPDRITETNEVSALVSDALGGIEKRGAERSININGTAHATAFNAMKAALELIAEQRGDDEKGPWSLMVDGAKVTNKATLEQTITNVLGDAEAFEGEFGGASYIRRNPMAGDIADQLTNRMRAASLKASGPEEVIGKFLGFDLVLHPLGKLSVELMAVDPKGRDLGSWRVFAEEDASKGEPPTVNAGVVRTALKNIESSIRWKKSSNEAYLRGQIAQAESELPKYREQEKAPFEHAEAKAAKVARLEEVIKGLAGKGAKPADFDYLERMATSFARGDRPTRTLPVKDIEAAIAPIRRVGKGLPPTMVVQSQRQLPDGLQRAIEDSGSFVKAAYHEGSIYIIADHVESTDEAAYLMLHEAAHYGLEGIFGRELAAVMMKIWSDNTTIREKAAAFRAEHGVSQAKAVEEILAEMAADGEKATVLQRFVAWVRDWFRRRGVQVKMSEGDILTILSRAQGYWKRSPKWTHLYSSTSFARAYHGSPNRNIDRFSTDYVGEGEGAQAYGWGLYFASKKAIADHYREVLSSGYEPTLLKDGVEFSHAADIAEAYYKVGRVFRGYGGNDVVLDFDRRGQYQWSVKVQEVDANGDPMYGTRPRWHSTMPDTKDLERVLGAEGYKVRRGQLYEVEVPEDDTLLLWDKPLSEQPEKARKALKGMGGATTLDDVLTGKTIPELLKWVDSFDRNNSFDEMLDENPDMTADDVREAIKSSYDAEEMAGYLGSSGFGEDRTGESIYRELATKSGGDKAASEALAAVGIKGIKYLDGGSRASGDGTHNYVIFDGDDAKILGTHFADGGPRGWGEVEGGPIGAQNAIPTEVIADDTAATVFESIRAWFIRRGLGELPAGALVRVAPQLDRLSDADALRGRDIRGAERIAQVFGHEVVWFENNAPEVRDFGGVVSSLDPKRIYINVRGYKPRLNVVGHELLHRMRAERPELYDRFLKAVTPLLQNTDNHQHPFAVGDDKQLEELLADFSGWNFMRRGFWREMAARDRSAFGKIADYILSFLDDLVLKMSRFVGDRSVYFSDVKAAQAALAEVMAEFKAGKAPMTTETLQFMAEATGRPPGTTEAQFTDNAPPSEGRFTSSYGNQARRAIDWIDAKLDPIGLLPGKAEYLAKRYATLGRIARLEEVSKELHKVFGQAPDEDQQAAYRFFLSPNGDPNMIPGSAARAAAVRAKSLIESVGDALVSREMMSPETREAHRGRYLPQVYLKFLLGDQNWKMLGAGKKVSDRGYLKNRKLDRIIGDDGEVHVVDAVTRQPVDEEFLNAVLGPVKDPGFLASMAIVKPSRDMAILDFLEQISEHEDWVLPHSTIEWRGRRVSVHWAKKESERLRRQARHMDDPEASTARTYAEELDTLADEGLGKITQHPDYRQIPDTSRYGRLRGIYVRKEIYDDLMGVNEFLPEDPGWFQSLFGYGGIGSTVTGWWKAGKVSLNPPAQIRNAVSNFVLLQLSGVSLLKAPGRVMQAWKEIAHGGPHWEIAKKFGVTESTWSSQELFRMRRDLLELEQRAGHLKALGKMKLTAAAIMDFAGDKYQFMEALFKTAKIIDEKARGKSDADAAIEAQRWLFDYSLVPKSVRYARSAPIGMPFLTFAYKVLPRLIEVATLHPQRLLPWVAMAYALPMIAAQAWDVDDDDIEQLKMAMPEWLRDRGHAYILPYKDEHDRWQVLDLGYFFPWTTWTEPLRNAAEGEVGKAAQGLGLFSGPITDLIVANATGKDSFTGRDIVQKGDPPQRQFLSIMNYLWSMAAPPIVTDYGAAGHALRAATGTTNRYGDPLSSAGQAALRAIGINVYALNPEQERAKAVKRMVHEVEDTMLRLKTRLSDRGLSQADRDDIVAEYVEEMKRRQQKIRDYLEESEIHPNLATGAQ